MNDNRPDEIQKLTEQLEAATRSGQTALWEKVLEQFTSLRENPSKLRQWWKELSSPLQTVVQQWAGGIVKVLGLNKLYFDEFQPGPELIASVRTDILDRMGLTEKGAILPGGYWDNVAKDTAVKQAISEQLWRSKTLPEAKARTILKELIIGTPENPGVLEKNWSDYTFDILHQTDRATQTAYANGLGMTASLFTGGIIVGSRPFCRARSGKVFLDAEIALFGTSADKYPGYQNKQTGFFSGKPKTGYDPFTQLGGYHCRHFRSYLSNAEAMRRRPDLKQVNGKLAIDPDHQPSPTLDPQPAKPKKTKKPPVDPAIKDLKTKTAYLSRLKDFKAYIQETVRKGMDKTFPDLTPIQRGTVFGYTTTEFHYGLNTYLNRQFTGEDLTPFADEARRYEATKVVLTDALLAIQPPYQGQVYRGVDLSGRALDRYRLAFESRQSLTEPFFISTSKDPDRSFSGNAEFFIETKSGRFIKGLSNAQHEEEVVIPAGASFRVTNFERLGGRTIVFMEEL